MRIFVEIKAEIFFEPDQIDWIPAKNMRGRHEEKRRVAWYTTGVEKDLQRRDRQKDACQVEAGVGIEPASAALQAAA